MNSFLKQIKETSSMWWIIQKKVKVRESLFKKFSQKGFGLQKEFVGNSSNFPINNNLCSNYESMR